MVDVSGSGSWLPLRILGYCRTMVPYSGVKVDLDSSENDRRTMSGNRLVVFADSL